jgi:hypothetical protein
MSAKRKRADNDSPWKEILEVYFPQAMQFFFPEIAALIDWERPHEFLDKEFQQIAREAKLGRRYADKLVKVWQLQGQEMWLLIHVEVQASPEDDFAKRMFSYLPRNLLMAASVHPRMTLRSVLVMYSAVIYEYSGHWSLSTMRCSNFLLLNYSSEKISKLHKALCKRNLCSCHK